MAHIERSGTCPQSWSGDVPKGKPLWRVIGEASKVISDALIHKLDDFTKLVDLYALLSKLRLFAPSDVLSMADGVMQRILHIYRSPPRSVHALLSQQDAHDLDVLRAFSEACRRDLRL